ncbi:1-deoxy-D-xylulose 5-phosphate synthase [Lachnospiraceae bacterium KM106-2]|nr:1-deoxy-D-xylulose 5-phosphate synthase [Lachnospiraceae bacterium KM106-2]
MFEILEQMKHPNDIKKIDPADYRKLAKEIRRFLIGNISKTGGHLASNLGVVELTMALHLSLDLPEDKIVWDVGHQAYTHKILTGRKEGFKTLRKYEGMSGFPKKSESDCDCFNTGHSSTSISAALGLAKARDIQKKDDTIVAVIGDGALSGGMAFEALNNAARMKSNLIIVLNDNNMSISENVGGMSNYLGKIRTDQKYQGLKDNVEHTLRKVPKVGDAIVERVKRSKDSIKRLVIPGMLFEDMGITYLGPIDGHNIAQMMTAFNNAKKKKGAVLVHVITKKGYGYKPAEDQPSKFHGIDPFDVKTGDVIKKSSTESYTQVFSDTLVRLGKENEKIVAVTAAMPTGTGLVKFQENYPDRFFDVGIAEEHAVTFAAGLADGGLKPFVAIYSTFLQRAYDQIIHDVCIGNYPVVFAIDRAGIVGNDGETHQGIFDLSYLMSIPNLAVIAPKNKCEFAAMLEFCAEYDKPIAIRYPRGAAYEEYDEFQTPIINGKCEILHMEEDILILSVGSMLKIADEVRDELKRKGLRVSIVNVRFVKPFDFETLDWLLENHSTVVTMEENVASGGFGQMIGSYLAQNQEDVTMIPIALPDNFLEHGDPDLLRKKVGFTKENISEIILKKREEA